MDSCPDTDCAGHHGGRLTVSVSQTQPKRRGAAGVLHVPSSGGPNVRLNSNPATRLAIRVSKRARRDRSIRRSAHETYSERGVDGRGHRKLQATRKVVLRQEGPQLGYRPKESVVKANTFPPFNRKSHSLLGDDVIRGCDRSSPRNSRSVTLSNISVESSKTGEPPCCVHPPERRTYLCPRTSAP